MKLADAIDLFVNRPEIAPATQRTYMYDLRALRDYLGPARLVTDIIPADLLRYIRHLDQSVGIKSAFTYNKHITSIKALFKFCLNVQIAPTNPATILKKKRVSERVPKSKAMPDRKLSKLLEYVKETPRDWNPREEALVRFIADTGVRIGSAASLIDNPERLNLKERWAAVEMKNMDELHIVHFGRECSHALSAWLLRRNATEGNYVFSTDGHRMTNDSLGQYFTRLAHRAGIGKWGPHSLRHRLGHKAATTYPASIGAKMLGDTIEIFLKHYAPQDDEAVHKAMMEMTTDHLLDTGLIVPIFKES
jgi:Site-specific recombinase XerD